MLTVAIIGAGPLGRWLALAAARAGYCVLLEDVMPANLHHAQEYIRQQLSPHQLSEMLLTWDGEGADLKAAGFRAHANSTLEMGPAASGAHLSKNSTVAFVSTIEDAVRNADLAIDCVPDELESKLEILWLLDRMAPPRTVLATPTTRLSIADLAACTYRAGKCVAIAAEARDLTARDPDGSDSEILLRTTPQTTLETIALVETFWQNLGFAPKFEPEAFVPHA